MVLWADSSDVVCTKSGNKATVNESAKPGLLPAVDQLRLNDSSLTECNLIENHSCNGKAG